MKRLPTQVAKQRSREVTASVEGWAGSDGMYAALVGSVQRCCVVDTAADGVHLVGHSRSYTQVGGWSQQVSTVPSGSNLFAQPHATPQIFIARCRCCCPLRRPTAAAACWGAWWRLEWCHPAGGR